MSIPTEPTLTAPAPHHVPAQDRLTWCEVDSDALRDNARQLKSLVGPSVRLAPVVKGNAYGHGLTIAARAFAEAGADWLCVFELDEAIALRRAGFGLPIMTLGRFEPHRAAEAIDANVRAVAFDIPFLEALSTAAAARGRTMPVHLEVETGNHRQGVGFEEGLELVSRISSLAGVQLEGVCTHFADIEDTTDHAYANHQLQGFERFVASCESAGAAVPIVHVGNSAATILWPGAHGGLVRCGIAAYGMWPSKETYISALQLHRHDIELRAALTWKARIVQVRDVPAGAYVGYGRSYRTTHPTRLATLGVGYYDGYDRGLSNQAYVLIDGHRAPVRGRVCMNLLMVDVTHVPSAALGGEATLLGSDASDRVTAEQLADWTGTINYEVTARIAAHVPRVDAPGGTK